MVQVAEATIDLTLKNLQTALGGLQQVQAKLAAIDLETKKPILERFSDSLGKLQTNLDKAATYATRFLVGLGAVVGLSAREFGQSEEAAARLGIAIRNTGGRVSATSESLQRLAASLQKTTKFSDDAIVSMTAMLSTFGGVNTSNIERTVKVVLDLASAMGTDLDSAAKAVGISLTDPAAGMALLRRQGVTFTDAQKDLVESLVQTNRMAEAQAVIFDRLEKSFGGAAEAVGNSFSGSLAKAKNAMSDMAESLGRSLAPALQKLAEDIRAVANAIGEWAEKNPSATARIIEWTAALAAAVIVLDKLVPLLGKAAKAIPIVGGAATSFAGSAAAVPVAAAGAGAAGGVGLQSIFTVFREAFRATSEETRARLAQSNPSWRGPGGAEQSGWRTVPTRMTDEQKYAARAPDEMWMQREADFQARMAKEDKARANASELTLGYGLLRGALGLNRLMASINNMTMRSPSEERQRQGGMTNPTDLYRAIQTAVLENKPAERTAAATEKTADGVGKLFEVAGKILDAVKVPSVAAWGK